MYTGVCKYGNPAGRRRVRAHASGRLRPLRPPQPVLPEAVQPSRQPDQTECEVKHQALFEAFLSFANFGMGSDSIRYTMDSKNFQKLAKDCHLLGRELISSDIDLIFMSIKPPKQRSIGFKHFLDGLVKIADRRGWPRVKVEEMIVKVGRPTSSGTLPIVH
uniref:Uncharacterized protein n=1 Tax=Tetraselmis sp. GSL018 TaxID=582737 RepID=A0A061RBF8_9CHLO